MKRPEATQPPRAFFIFRRFGFVLEVKLQAELDQARPAVGDNLTRTWDCRNPLLSTRKNWTWLKALKNSARNSSDVFSLRVVCLVRERSQLLIPGPRK